MSRGQESSKEPINPARVMKDRFGAERAAFDKGRFGCSPIRIKQRIAVAGSPVRREKNSGPVISFCWALAARCSPGRACCPFAFFACWRASGTLEEQMRDKRELEL